MERLAIVTGGTRGIGAAISRELKAGGCRVAAVYHGDAEAAKSFSDNTGIASYKWDVADFSACERGVAAVVAELGPVDILVNNAGITRDAMLHRMTPTQWQEVLTTNLFSCFNMCRVVIESMRGRGFGRIVNISSINGLKGQMGQTNYSASKAGIIGFSKALALESAAKGITVNAIAPGYVATDMVAAMPQDVLAKVVAQIPVGRLGNVEEVARAVRFLVADDASFITGATLSINGGQYLA
jgi:acetoacetyl-CoA reductase